METGKIIKRRNKDGVEYSVRTDRRRYFFPDEWLRFISTFKNKTHKFFFITCLHTGGRAMEVLNLRHQDIDIERGTVNFTLVKQRTAKKNYASTGKTRGFFVASEFIKEYKSFVRGKTIKPEEYIFLNNSKLPANYSSLINSERKKFYYSVFVGYGKLFKRKLQKAKITDWFNFSLHNIRKTYGMWMRTYNKDFGELCYRMGHDMDTYIAHYGSSLIFTDDERRKISNIMGDVK